MFYEWVAAGAAFGIKAFFAMVVFLVCVGAVLGLLAAIASVFKGGDEK